MNNKELDTLLKKYYNGETTLDEERLLRKALNGYNSADALLMAEWDSFDKKNPEVPADLEQMLSDKIDEWEESEKKVAKVAPSLWRRSAWWAAAASIAVMAAIGWWYMNNNPQTNLEKKPPVIAKTMKIPTIKIQPHVPIHYLPQQTQQNSSKVKLAKVYKKNPSHLAQASPKPASEQINVEEEMALAALEKFSTLLNKGTSQLNEASEKIDEINNTIKQHLYID